MEEIINKNTKMNSKNWHNLNEELNNGDRLNNDWDLKYLKSLLEGNDKIILRRVHKVFRDLSDNGDLIFLSFILKISEPENIEFYDKFLNNKWFWKESLDKVIWYVTDNIDIILENKKKIKSESKNKIKPETKNKIRSNKKKEKKEASFEIEKVRKLSKSSFVFDLKKEWLKKRIWFLSFREIKNNIYYIDGFSVDDDLKRQWLGGKLMEEFKNYLWDNWMWFLNDHTNNYWINSPYEKYWWNKEKFIPELVKRKVYYFWNDTKGKKIELKWVTKKFYNIK